MHLWVMAIVGKTLIMPQKVIDISGICDKISEICKDHGEIKPGSILLARGER